MIWVDNSYRYESTKNHCTTDAEENTSESCSCFMGYTTSNTTKHDGVIKWEHFPRYWPFVQWICRWPVNSPHKGQWREALMFSLIWTWTNGWVNNGDAAWCFETPSRPLWRHCNERSDSQVLDRVCLCYCCVTSLTKYDTWYHKQFTEVRLIKCHHLTIGFEWA